ncbi:MAG: phosphotransferase [Nitrospirota bacterium]|nr:phosphotransferase [Nitrospirota bacterium]
MPSIMQNEPATVFEKFHDPTWVKLRLQHRLPNIVGYEGIIQHCDISYLHYKRYLKPRSLHKSFLALCYELSITDDHGYIQHSTIFAKVYLGDQSRLEYAKLMEERVTQNATDQQPLHLADLNMIVWLFPSDPSLPQLPGLLDPSRVIHYFPPGYCPVPLTHPTPIFQVTRHVVHYRPECRCTIRYYLQGDPTIPDSTVMLFAKTFKDDGREIFQRMEMLWNLSQQNPNTIKVPKPLSYDESIHTIWQEGVPGLPLSEVIQPTNYHDYLQSVGRGLAILQQSPLPSSSTIFSHDHVMEFHKKAQKLSQVFPSGSEVLQKLGGKLEDLALSDGPIPTQLIHGDFHIGQLLADNTQVTFFDLDECAMGDPLQDVANFLVDLHFQKFSSGFRQQMTESFVKAYTASVPWDVSERRLDWHAAIQFTNKVYRSFIQRKPSFEEDFDRFMNFLKQSSLSTTEHANP